jgi:hypothetical protein
VYIVIQQLVGRRSVGAVAAWWNLLGMTPRNQSAQRQASGLIHLPRCGGPTTVLNASVHTLSGGVPDNRL